MAAHRKLAAECELWRTGIKPRTHNALVRIAPCPLPCRCSPTVHRPLPPLGGIITATWSMPSLLAVAPPRPSPSNSSPHSPRLTLIGSPPQRTPERLYRIRKIPCTHLSSPARPPATPFRHDATSELRPPTPDNSVFIPLLPRMMCPSTPSSTRVQSGRPSARVFFTVCGTTRASLC